MIESSVIIQSRKKLNDLGRLCIEYGLNEVDLFDFIHEYKLEKPKLFKTNPKTAHKPTKKSTIYTHGLFIKEVD